MRLLFSSIHCYLDPASGAALCSRELQAARAADRRVLTTGILDRDGKVVLPRMGRRRWQLPAVLA
jgi:hypothetical protein